ncbi:MAG: aldose 1-epimerase [Actinomycetaceae bacterium]|nr:aldose 1-epimerase [Arcanobacterium sp.]MDD7505257.1 aldose 1-epimerase [Actinomycetaceae bacterium]MDY6144020.1 aldose 1-epimerase [Arcanobacterium sp.]
MAAANGERVEQIEFDGMPAWALESASGARAVVAERGAAVLSWEPRPGANLIDGYHNRADFESAEAQRSTIAAPWTGRMRGNSYVFAGEKYTVPVPEGKELIHGLAWKYDFTAEAIGATLNLRLDFPGEEGYPWPFTLLVRYSLDMGADDVEHLTVTITVINTNDHAIPMAIGWQPYVKLPGNKTISNYSLTIPARTKILVDPDLVPRAGEAAYSGVKAPVVIDYLGANKYNTSFRGLVPGEDGVVTTVLSDLSSTQRIELAQEPAEASVVHVFTGDILSEKARESIALEPLSHLPDAFNRADAAGSIALAPGAARSMTATLSYIE